MKRLLRWTFYCGVAVGAGKLWYELNKEDTERQDQRERIDETTTTDDSRQEQSREESETNERTDSDSGENTTEFECEDCGRTFDTEHGLNVHRGKSH